jgi:arylsulfatase A-like enzyme
LRRRDLLLIATFFALLGAYGELAMLVFDAVVRAEHARVGLQVVWMTPAADVLLFACLALLAMPTLGLFRRGTALRIAATGFALLAALGVVGIEHWSYPSGGIVLALGIGVATGRRAAEVPARFFSLSRRTVPVLAVLTFVLGAGYNLLVRVREARALAALPAMRAGAPNVLLLIWDTVRADDLDLYGFALPTSPALDSLARRGVTFDRAIVTVPWTLPSHASIFTGRYRNELNVGWLTPLGSRWPTLAGVLTRRGYQTAGFVANLIYTSYEFGLDRGFVHYEDYVVTPAQFALASSLVRLVSNNRLARHLAGNWQIIGRKHADDVNAELFAWLDGGRRKDRPFFVFLNEFDAHEPYYPPRPFDTRFGSGPRYHGWGYDNTTNGADLLQRWRLTPREVAAERARYDGGIAYMDSRLGQLLAGLRRRGLLDNTIVIVAADHGEEFGHHGVHGHGHSLYLPAVSVPLVISWPRGMPSGRRVAEPVSLADLPATVTDLLDVPQEPFPGRSLARFWDPATPGHPGEQHIALSEMQGSAGADPVWYPAHSSSLTGIVDQEFHLIRGGRGVALFDIAHDPFEDHDLAPDPAYAGVRARLDAELAPLHRPETR